MLTGPQRLCVAKEKRLNASVRPNGFKTRGNHRNGPYIRHKLHMWDRKDIILLKCPCLEFWEIWGSFDPRIIYKIIVLSKLETKNFRHIF
jgi:hypothetical protein